MQRTGGTSLTNLLESMHLRQALHEPLTAGKARRTYAHEAAQISAGEPLPDAFRSRNVKHCYEYATPDFNEAINRAFDDAGFVPVFLRRRNEAARFESLMIAELTNAYKIASASLIYPKVRSGEVRLPPIDLPDAVSRLKRSRRRTAEVSMMLAAACTVDFEDLFSGPAEDRDRCFARLVREMRNAGVPLEDTANESARNAYLHHAEQNTSEIAEFVPNINEFRAAVRNCLSMA